MGSSKPKEKSGKRGENNSTIGRKVASGRVADFKGGSVVPPKGELVSKITRKPKGEAGPLDIIRATREGFPRTTLEELAQALDVDKVIELEPILNVSKRTLQRYGAEGKNESLSVELSDHILQVAKVYERTVEVFGDRTKALEWLKSPIMALGHEVPLFLLDTSAGIELVLDELIRIEHGVFA